MTCTISQLYHLRVQIRKKENPAAEIKDEKSFWNTLLNNGKWRAMENEWKKELKAGKKVEVEIQIIYDGDINKRPKRFLGEYKVGNEHTIQKIFNN